MHNKLSEIIEPALELLTTAKELSDFCLSKIYSENYDEILYRCFEDLSQSISTVEDYITPYLSLLRSNSVPSVCHNIIDALERFVEIPPYELRYPVFTFKNEIRGAIYGLYDALEFLFKISPDKVKLRAYYDQRNQYCLDARNLDITTELAKIEEDHEITIVIMTFNLLEYFSQCFESILQYTDFSRYKIQLIVFDHGSTDGTLEYLEQFSDLPFLRVHHCKENIKCECVFMDNYYTWYDSKYTLIVANDTIATENYLENLLACIKSDDRIAWICPSMCNTSNNQGITVNYSTIEEMHEFASQYNHSDPTKWEELTRLIPVFSMYNNICRKAIHHADPIYYEFLFGDDDISRSFIRAGFRMLVCKDTYIHHYPSMTVSKGNDYGNRMLEMRKVFFDKFHFDAWDGFSDVLTQYMLQKLNPLLDSPGNKKFLFIEPDIGRSIAYLRTLMHQKKIKLSDVEIYSIGKNKYYKLDMEGYSTYSHIVEEYEDICSLYPDKIFDAVVIPNALEDLLSAHYLELFAAVYRIVKPGGHIKLFFKNLYYAENAFDLLTNGSLPPVDLFEQINVKPLSYLKLHQVNALLQKCGFSNISYVQLAKEMSQFFAEYPLVQKVENVIIDEGSKINNVMGYFVDVTL